jgi:hypothetical protein
MKECLSLPTGQNAAPTPTSAQPVLATGQTLSATTDTAITVVAGRLYGNVHGWVLSDGFRVG